ncbi:HlyD family efflux transporter periplasmic adaptor subunit [Actinoplanes sp. LDG1-06]|uniref:HlyD family efflux transporter periplasmic adaptor subunit n=1 Tax=Paractinoplanes ovalisporus TaxID=2810368 RepID=A0ABS2AVB5_9ACTN|nr:HlyD family efflux transporter periplasmic adaptor subunit [Actinoplanes ovalisporus]MBM2623820.1 HlyD family efflux transporter periplasmic adaptor subunit [Actinoplanes ovalisporus]
MRKRISVTVVAIVMVLGGAYARYAFTGHDAGPTGPSEPTVATAEVVKTNLSDYWSEIGVVGYSRQRSLRGNRGGVVTWLPKAGSTVARGGTLYQVGERPVALFYGDAPMFRDIGAIGTVGHDIKVLADNLKALGYRIGRQPAPGTWVTTPGEPAPADDPGRRSDDSDGEKKVTDTASKPVPAASGTPSSFRTVVTAEDGVFTASLKHAVQRWQAANGVRPADGTLYLGDVVVLSGGVRVGAARAQLGDDAGEELMQISDEAKAITVAIAASRAGGLKAGNKVQVTLPDSTTTTGTIRSVSTDVQAQPGGDESSPDGPQVRVLIGVDKPSAIRNISSADVEVRFTGTTRRNVLAVPVGALIALRGGGYGVQVSGGALTAVRIGMFADGMVQIAGAGIVAGTRVVTTS